MKILLLDRICSRCQQSGYFYQDRSKKDGIHSICTACHKTYKKLLHSRDSEARDRSLLRSKTYRENNPDKFKRGVANSTLKAKYGITLDEYIQLLNSQNGVCKVCGDAPTYQRLHVDHHHGTGKIRGLLCQPCNTSIGKMKENPELMRKLANYVENSL